jgi:hypothetical protein
MESGYIGTGDLLNIQCMLSDILSLFTQIGRSLGVLRNTTITLLHVCSLSTALTCAIQINQYG